MSAYTQPILRYGLITPLVFNGLLLGAVGFGYFKLSNIRAEKQKLYQENNMRLTAIKQLESQIAPQRKLFDEQKKMMQADPGQLFTKILDVVLPKYNEFELERTSLVFPLERGAMGTLVKSDISRVKSSFEGGMGPMQETFLQVEALMPQALLEDLKIIRKSDPLFNRPDHLLIDAIHTCWKAGEAKPEAKP